MSMTLKNYRDIVIIKTGIEGNRLFGETRLNFMVNKAIKFVQSKLNGLGYKRWENSVTYSTTGASGSVTGVSVYAGGTNYVVGDLIVITFGANNCVLNVLTTGASGAVASVGIVQAGSGYSVATNLSTTTNSVAGSGFKAHVTAISSAFLLNATALGSVSCVNSPIPVNMLESSSSIIMVDVTDGSSRGTTKLEYSPTQFESACSNSYMAQTIKEAAYMRLANYIYFYPATIITAILYYFCALADLVSDADTSQMPVEFEDFVIQKLVNDIKADLGEIKDVQAADAAVANAISDAFNKAVSTSAQRGSAMTQRDSEVVQ
jgi:hypothetical protein